MANGLFKIWFKNGQLDIEGNHKDDKEDGLWKSQYESGQLKTEFNNKDGKPDGFFKTWYENGQLEKTGYFKDGQVISTSPQLKDNFSITSQRVSIYRNLRQQIMLG